MSRVIACAVFVIACGCGKSKSECRSEAKQLGDFLTAMDHDPSLIYLGRGDPALVERTDLPKADVRQAPVVEIGATAIEYQGQPLTTTDELRERLDAAAKTLAEDAELGRYPERFEPDTRLIHFVIDAAATWARVAPAIEVAADVGFSTPTLIFRRPSATPPPPRTKIDDDLDKLQADDDASTKATQLAEMMKRVTRSCGALNDVFGAVAAYEGDDRAGYMLQQVAPAVVACGCDVDIPTLRSLLWRVLGNPTPLAALAVEVARDGAVATIELPAGTPWSDASKRFTVDTKLVRLSIAK